MLNADDPESVLALRQLATIAADGTRPIVYWVGAGASRWLGYPSWKELALQLRRTFFKQVLGFDNSLATGLLNKEDFPAIFQMCRDLDSALYYRFMAEAFAPCEQNGIYKAFVGLLGKLQHPFVLTTNVDEALESSMPLSTLVQRTDIGRCVDLLQRRKSFIAKLHGSVSSVRSTVFTTSEYEALVSDPSYVQPLKYIFTGCTVVFLGYGVRDAYVLRILQQNEKEMELFGPGPHFVVTNDNVTIRSLRRIKYSLKVHPDHSAALSTLDYIIQSIQPPSRTASAAVPGTTTDESPKPPAAGAVPPGKTAYFISELLPPGTWSTSTEIKAKPNEEDSPEFEASFGLGFTDDEIPFRTSTAMHDMVVGLICFDYIYLSLTSLVQAHTLFGPDLFWELIRCGVLRFIHTVAQIGARFVPGQPMGTIVSVTAREQTGVQPRPLSEIITRNLQPAPGKEKEAQQLFETLERQTAIYGRTDEINLPSLVRGALIMPAVSRLLGVGDAILPTQVPRWLRYPYLRLAHLVQTAAFSAEYGIQAAKVSYGGTQLTSASFGVQPAELHAEHLASYASSGFSNSDLGALVYQDMRIVTGILRFRETAEGEFFRREIGQVLALEGGREFNASINAGLSRTVPHDVLDRAHDKLLILMTESARITRVPAVWSSTLNSDTATKYWRAKSEKELLEMCNARGIGKNDPCICGSHEKLRLCCLAPLRA